MTDCIFKKPTEALNLRTYIVSMTARIFFFEEPYPVHAHLLRNSRSRRATFVTVNSSPYKGEIHTKEADLDMRRFRAPCTQHAFRSTSTKRERGIGNYSRCPSGRGGRRSGRGTGELQCWDWWWGQCPQRRWSWQLIWRWRSGFRTSFGWCSNSPPCCLPSDLQSWLALRRRPSQPSCSHTGWGRLRPPGWMQHKRPLSLLKGY